MSCNSSDELRFHRDHLWVRIDANSGDACVGISDFAQKQLGKIMFVDLPQAGARLEAGTSFGAVESYKVVSELIAPASGEVLESNEALKQAAGLLNQDCYGAGWLLRIRVDEPANFAALLTEGAYLALYRR